MLNLPFREPIRARKDQSTNLFFYRGRPDWKGRGHDSRCFRQRKNARRAARVLANSRPWIADRGWIGEGGTK